MSLAKTLMLGIFTVGIAVGLILDHSSAPIVCFWGIVFTLAFID
jgi:hypothetical protein